MVDFLDTDFGSAPGFLTSSIEGPLEDAVNDAFEAGRFRLDRPYAVEFGEGVVIVSPR